MFEKSATDLIRGIRANSANESQYIDGCISEIKQELQKDSLSKKAVAISKLCVLHVLGYNMQWASFYIVEIMASPVWEIKRIGYHAAHLCFNHQTDLLMLCTNLIKKDLNSNVLKEGLVALHTLGQIVDTNLARDLHADVIVMIAHSQPHVRNRSILTLYRLFLKYPDSLKIAFPRIKEKLSSDNIEVVSSCVSVICELAKRNPKAYLPLAPQLFALLIGNGPTWMLIKIVKLLASLVPVEPRLAKKLEVPLYNIIQTTPSISLMFECIQTSISCITPIDAPESNFPANIQLVSVCIEKLKLLIDNDDQNCIMILFTVVKFLGLSCMVKLLKVRPDSVSDMIQTFFLCLDDEDINIRTQALELIAGVVSSRNIFAVVKRLVIHLTTAKSTDEELKSRAHDTDRTEVAKKIIAACSQNTYANINNFEWYLSVLVDLYHCSNIDAGAVIRDQFIDICIKVRDIREFAVVEMCKIFSRYQSQNSDVSEQPEVLQAAAWICGEYSSYVQDSESILNILTSPKSTLPSHTQAAFLLGTIKVYAKWIGSNPQNLISQTNEWITKINLCINSSHLEVENIASMSIKLLKYCIHLPETPGSFNSLLPAIFSKDIEPVAETSQKRVPVPDGLDLDKWVFKLPAEDIIIVESRLPDGNSIENSSSGKKIRPKFDAFYLSDSQPIKSVETKDFKSDSELDVSSPKKSTDDGFFDFESVSKRPPVKKYVISAAIELEPLSRSPDDELLQMKVSDPDRFAVMSVDPFKTDSIREAQFARIAQEPLSIPVKTERKKKVRKDKTEMNEQEKLDRKDKKLKKKVAAHNLQQEVEQLYIGAYITPKISLRYSWSQIHEMTAVTFLLDPMPEISYQKLYSESSMNLENAGEYKWICKINCGDSLEIPLSLSFTDSGLSNLENFTICLPITAKILTLDERTAQMNSQAFLTLVQIGFPYSRQESLLLKTKIAFSLILEKLVSLNMRQVDVISDSAVSLIGFTASNPIVALVILKNDLLSADFKGYDKELVEGMAVFFNKMF